MSEVKPVSPVSRPQIIRAWQIANAIGHGWALVSQEHRGQYLPLDLEELDAFVSSAYMLEHKQPLPVLPPRFNPVDRSLVHRGNEPWYTVFRDGAAIVSWRKDGNANVLHLPRMGHTIARVRVSHLMPSGSWLEVFSILDVGLLDCALPVLQSRYRDALLSGALNAAMDCSAEIDHLAGPPVEPPTKPLVSK